MTRPTSEQLAAHVDAGMSESQIGRLYGVSRNIVHGWRYERKRRRPPKPAIEQIALGLTLGLTERQMAALLGVPRSTIQGMRRKWGLPNTSNGRPRRIVAGKGESKPHRAGEQAGIVRLLPDETVWAGVLAGARYESADPGDGGPLRRLPVEACTGNSSMSGCADW